MQRASFDAIMRNIGNEPDEDGSTPTIRFSLRNQEIYEGPWQQLSDAPDVIQVIYAGGTTFIALTAIATISEIRS
ncbi:hypothetical protein [Methylobacterium sp. WL120]|uniref:hypothetical protein n=1 Tax=Methylobacterium sp. WL120 TaxID=2603887 RepID=UPI0011CB5DA9|nr:hypothetical protein [Methylobacterium sp. WL120]TXM69644.1 hypothetical protein FV229_04685 [Methylobacterium sp. WL120]